MIGPTASEVVWLKTSWSRTAHRLNDRTNFGKAPCGLLIYTMGLGPIGGERIRWDSLDQQRVELCKICWKGYTPVDSRTINELKWWAAQHERISQIFAEAWTVISVPTHLEEFIVEGPGGNVVHSRTLLNYQTLKAMLKIMLEEETYRKVSRERMGRLMGALRTWESAHPYGEPLIDDPEIVEEGEIVDELVPEKKELLSGY
jgi:hypothetical protein